MSYDSPSDVVLAGGATIMYIYIYVHIYLYIHICPTLPPHCRRTSSKRSSGQ